MQTPNIFVSMVQKQNMLNIMLQKNVEISTCTDPSNDTFAEHIKYYSENTPTESGKYWHFLEDGVTPILWMV